MTLPEVYVFMKAQKNNICIIGSYDKLSKIFFDNLLIKNPDAILINLGIKNTNSKKIYNLKIYELKKILDVLAQNNVSRLIFLGDIMRPDLTSFKLDGVIDKFLPSIFNAYKQGDGHILDVVIKIFKSFKFKIKSPLIECKKFALNQNEVNTTNSKVLLNDLVKGRKILDALSKFDNAQSIVLINGYIIAVEAIEGTDEMLKRVKILRKKNKSIKYKQGLLIKLPKKSQSRLIDLPVIGPKTLQLVVKSNLAAIVIDFRNTIVVRKEKFIEEANKRNIKILSV